MIKFFRRIRQKLLNESKLRKYILYAIGEIILVIIGILIALSINIGFENRKLQNEIEDYLNIIKADISTDVAAAKEIKLYRDSSKYYSLKSLENIAINKNILGIQDIDKVFSTKYNPTAVKILGSRKSAFNALISSGLIAKLENPKIKNTIFDYYETIGEVVKKEVQIHNNIIYLNRELFVEVGIGDYFNYLSNPKLIQEKHQIWFKKFTNSHFLSSFHVHNLDDLGLQEGYSEVIKQGEQIIQLLESEYN